MFKKNSQVHVVLCNVVHLYSSRRHHFHHQLYKFSSSKFMRQDLSTFIEELGLNQLIQSYITIIIYVIQLMQHFTRERSDGVYIFRLFNQCYSIVIQVPQCIISCEFTSPLHTYIHSDLPSLINHFTFVYLHNLNVLIDISKKLRMSLSA